MPEELSELIFHIGNLKFEARKNVNMSSDKILRAVIDHIIAENKEGHGILIERHKDSKTGTKRPLLITNSRYLPHENRIICKIALLREGRQPKVKPNDSIELEPLKIDGTIAEDTHFFIDYSKNPPVLCAEYRHDGPRFSDITYYLNKIARYQLKLSKKMEFHLSMEASLDDALNNLRKVLNIDVKVKPRKLHLVDPKIVGQYFTSLSNLGQHLKPQFVKLEILFQTPGQTGIKSEHVSKPAKNMVLDIIRNFKNSPDMIEGFENFVVKYEDDDGIEQTFNLLKGKTEFVYETHLSKLKKLTDWYELIKEDLDKFIHGDKT